MTSITLNKRHRLRAILQGNDCVFAGSVYDPLSARVADMAGLQVGLLGGSLASMAVLGAPDIMLLTLSELVDQARRICRASSLPVIVDADSGYGNALNVMRAVEELADAGVAGISLEDTLLPAAFGSSATAVVSVDEALGKFAAAVAAAHESGLVVIGRTSALVATDAEDAARRLAAYEATGIDAIFVPYLKTRQQLDLIAAATRLPMVLGSPCDDVIDPALLRARRVRICLRGHLAMPASVQAMLDVARAARTGDLPDKSIAMASEATMATLTRRSDYDNQTRLYMGTGPAPEDQLSTTRTAGAKQ